MEFNVLRHQSKKDEIVVVVVVVLVVVLIVIAIRVRCVLFFRVFVALASNRSCPQQSLVPLDQSGQRP